MLLLHRKPGTAIVIGDDVTVTVVRVEGAKVVLGVQAPPEVAVCRDDARKVPPHGVGPQSGHRARAGDRQGHKT